jgi:hypothetical protein
MPLAGGATFAGYTILRLLGRGGMSEVYLAQHPRLPRRDALKILPEPATADSGFRKRFHYRTPFVATRVGDVAPSVIVADPALLMTPATPAPDSLH